MKDNARLHSPSEAGLGAVVEHNSRAELLRMALHARDLRKRIEPLFPRNMFRDSAWDMLFELFVATLREERLFIKDLVYSSNDSPTSALRRVDQLESAGFIERVVDQVDHRRVWVVMTPKAGTAMATMLRHMFDIGETASQGQARGFTPAPEFR